VEHSNTNRKKGRTIQKNEERKKDDTRMGNCAPLTICGAEESREKKQAGNGYLASCWAVNSKKKEGTHQRIIGRCRGVKLKK